MFSLFEASRTLGDPITFIFVRYGAGLNDFYALNDGEENLTRGGVLYSKAQFQCPEITASGTLDKTSIEIRAPVNGPLTEIFRPAAPDNVVALTMYMGHRSDPDAEIKQIWAGRILSFRIESDESVYTCDPSSTSLRRVGLRRCYTYGCPHVLYGPNCRASKTAATRATTVSAIAGETITLAGGWNGTFAASSFNNGTLEWAKPSGSPVARTILKVNGDGTVVIAGIPSGLIVGQAVNAVLGCGHNMDDCENLHDNITRFGGCSWVPTDNPVGARNNFY